MDQGPIDLDRLDREIGELVAVGRPIDYAPPQYRDKLPDYVEHSPGVSTIGALTAAASVKMYEEAAAAIEALAEDEKNLVEECEKTIVESQVRSAEIKAIAEEYREEAKKSFARIENRAKLTAEVTKTCEDLRKKIALDEAPA